MFKHYLVTAWRNFLRFKLITSINVLGLTLGLACFFAAIGTVIVLGSADRTLPNVDRVATVWVRITEANASLKRPYLWFSSEGVAAAIAKEVTEIEGVAWFNTHYNLPVGVGDRRMFLDAGVVDVSFLDIVNLRRVQAISGNPLASPRSVALSESAAKRLFNSTDVLGRTIRLRDKFDVTVTAVLKSLPRPSNFSPEAMPNIQYEVLFSRDTQAALVEAVTGKPVMPTPVARQWGLGLGAATFVLLPEDGSLSFSQLESRLKGLAKRNGASDRVNFEFRVVPLSKAYLTRLDFTILRDIAGLSINRVLMLLAVVVLAVACANYAHLSFAQARYRLRETGLRRSLGAKRSQLALQAFIEAVCHLSVALILSLSLVFALAAIVGSRKDTEVIALLFGSGRFWGIVALCTTVVAALIAAYPAFTLSRVKPVNAVQTSSRRSVGAQLLMGGQFVATGAFMVVVFVGLLQNSAIRDKALQPNEDPLVTLGAKWQLSGTAFETWRTELLKSSAIQVVSATQNPPWSDAFTLLDMQAQHGGGRFDAMAHDIGYDYEKAVGFQFLAGRPFDRRFGDIEKRRTNSRAIIDESLSRRLGYVHPKDAIGQRLSIGEGIEIVAVIEDKPLRIQPFQDALGNVYFPAVRQGSMPIIKLDRTRIAEGMKHIDAVWKTFVPDEPVSRYFTDEAFQRSYLYYSLLGTVLTIGGGIALGVSLLGAFGFALFAGQQRAHEIGVRKTLGASAERILTMLLKDFSKPILIANILGWPLGYLAVQKYLSLYIERIDVTIVPFVASMAISLLVVWLAVGRQAWRAARMNPATVLRHE
jgi:putative ABC transport system permease protein